MTTWSGWQADFLSAASLPDTANNRKFLSDWAANANYPGCADNPIDLTHKEPGSINCHSTGQVGVNVQAYSSHTWARTAFNTQIHSSAYSHLLAALRSGNPYAVNDSGAVSTELGLWSSTKFANVYLGEAGSTSAGLKAPHAHKGWADLQHSVNHVLPTALKDSRKLGQHSLQSLARARRLLK